MTDNRKRSSAGGNGRTSVPSNKKKSSPSSEESIRTLNVRSSKRRKTSSKSGSGSAKRSAPQPQSSRKSAQNSSQSNIRFADTKGSRVNRGNVVAVNGGAAAVSGGAAAVSAKPKPKIRFEAFYGFDYTFFCIVMLLLAFGLIMMFSASYATAYSATGDSLFYLKRQAVFAAAGVGVMIVASVVDYHIFKTKGVVILLCVGSVLLMAAVKLVGTTQGGSERWLQIGEITFQPSEVLKFAIIVFFAYLTEKRFGQIREFKKGALPFFAALGLSCLLLLAQPHLSGTIIVFLIGFVMMFVAGVRPKYLIALIVLLVVGLAVAMPILNAAGFDYFSTRWLSFVDPEADPGDKTWQTYQSLVTIGSGGLFGLGFGNSRQKYGYLPMSRNDFIFSIICEELGFVGAMLVIILFIILIARGFYICTRARDKFGMMLAFGITFQIGLQALLNIAVVSNSIPNTGISLPFFSYGGTALLMQLGEMGVLLNISRKAELE